jgi:acyl-coenzyme A synthetase/AMP-(fatty) acid ligase
MIVRVMLERLSPRLVVTDSATAGHAGIGRDGLGGCTVVGIDAVDGALPLASLWDEPVPAPTPVRDGEAMLVTHTSSTTGIPKLVVTTAASVTFSALMESVFPFAHGRDEMYANAISHVHVAGAAQQMCAFSRGTPVLGIGRTDPATIAALFARYRPTIVEAHPNDFLRWEPLTDHPDEPFASVRIFFNTFDAIHPRTMRRLLNASRRRLPVWVDCYGTSETQVLTVAAFTRRSVRRRGDLSARAIGWTVPGVKVRVVDPDTREPRADQSEPGLIQAKTRARALSFVAATEKFTERQHGAWFDTGDWGRRGRWGQLEVLDRVADRIDGVESCLAIEDALLDRIPGASEVVIVPNPDGGPVPVVCMRDGASLSVDEWGTVSADMPQLASPFRVTETELPRTATVKTRRYLLSQMVASGAASDARTLSPDVVLREGA